AVPALLKLLEKTDRRLAEDAMEALGRIGPEAKAAVPLLTARLKDKDESTRARAAQALGQIGPDAKKALPDLKKLLTDERERVRVWAAVAVVRITGDSKSHFPALLELWKEDSGEEGPFAGWVRSDLAKAFELLGVQARPALDLLLDALMDEQLLPGTQSYVA